MTTTLPTLADLPPGPTTAVTPDELSRELVKVIRTHIAFNPRTIQEAIGPSELGTPCDRRLAHRLAGTPQTNPSPAGWRAETGTAIHQRLGDIFTLANRGLEHARWLVETRVSVGTINGTEITGTCDLCDRWTRTAVDWKTTTRHKIEEYKRNGPGRQYREQAHLYGRGWVNRGQPIDTVMVVFLPRDAELAAAYTWHEPYDETVAAAALARANHLTTLTNALGPGAFAHLDTADDYCAYCPWFEKEATDLTRACPGDTTPRHNPLDPLNDAVIHLPAQER